MDAAGQARALEAVLGLLQCPGGQAMGHRWLRAASRVATLASTTRGHQSQASLRIDWGS